MVCKVWSVIHQAMWYSVKRNRHYTHKNMNHLSKRLSGHISNDNLREDVKRHLNTYKQEGEIEMHCGTNEVDHYLIIDVTEDCYVYSTEKERDIDLALLFYILYTWDS